MLRLKMKELLIECRSLRKSNNSKDTELKVREKDLKEYSAAMGACKPIILNAIKSRVLTESYHGSDHPACTFLAKQKALAEYKERFEVSGIDLVE